MAAKLDTYLLNRVQYCIVRSEETSGETSSRIDPDVALNQEPSNYSYLHPVEDKFLA